MMLPVGRFSLSGRREASQPSQSEVVTTRGDGSMAGASRLKRILQVAAAGAATSGLTAIVDFAGCPRVVVSLGAVLFIAALSGLYPGIDQGAQARQSRKDLGRLLLQAAWLPVQ